LRPIRCLSPGGNIASDLDCYLGAGRLLDLCPLAKSRALEKDNESLKGMLPKDYARDYHSIGPLRIRLGCRSSAQTNRLSVFVENGKRKRYIRILCTG
jgi:hypothetical protein